MLALVAVTSVLFTSELALATAIAAVLVFVGIWYVLPMLGKPAIDEDDDGRAAPAGDGKAQEPRGASSPR